MIITQPALFCLTSFWSRLAGRPELPAAGPATVAPAPVREPARAVMAPAASSHVAVAAPPAAAAMKPAPAEAAGREPAAPVVAEDRAVAAVSNAQATATPPDGAPLTASERRARAAALRALAFSRARRFDAAQAAFTDAARLDPALDLTRVPSFWSLERSAHEAAIAAYVAADRAGDAAVLRARVHSVYRPKPLRVRQAAAATP